MSARIFCPEPWCGYHDYLPCGHPVPDSGVQIRVQEGSAPSGNGRGPHHDRVLAIVLVMPDGREERFVPDGRVEPNTPHAEEFWHDLGRPDSGQERTSEAMDVGAGVQRACPTGLNPQFTEAKGLGCLCEWVGRGSIITFHPYCPILPRHRGGPKSAVDFTAEQLDAAVSMVRRRSRTKVASASLREWMTPKPDPEAEAAQRRHRNVLSTRRTRLRAEAGRVNARLETIERIGPLPEPYSPHR